MQGARPGGEGKAAEGPGGFLRALLPGAAASLTLPPHLRGNPAFLAAVGHTRRVVFLRRAIPMGAMAVIAFLILRALAGLFFSGEASISTVSIQGRKIVMEKPKLSGFKRDGRSYELTAITATQDLKMPNVVELDRLTARFQTGNDGWANLDGARGVYDSKIERLSVDGGLRVKTEAGLDARLKDALIEFKAGTIITDKPVEVKIPQGDIESDSLQVLDNGRKLIFEGRVRSIFTNAQAQKAGAAAAETTEAESEPAKE